MAQTNVSNGILSIIASFSNGLDVLKKLRRKTPKKKKKTSKWTDISGKQQTDNDEAEQALRLSRSLRRGVDDIGREYQARSMRCDGERYAVGDATAQSSLAEILIKFNTGLVSIITSFLGREDDGRKHRTRRLTDLDYASLTDLSEQSREQSITVLRQLYQRIVLSSSRSSLSNPHNPSPPDQKPKRKAKKRLTARPPTLARVVIKNSRIPSQIALVRPSDNSSKSSTKKPRSRSQSQAPTPQKSALSLASSNLSIPHLPPPPYFPSDPLPQPCQSSSQANLNVKNDFNPSPRREASSASLFKPSNPPKQQHTPLPPSSVCKPRPTTLYSTSSTRTTSTKLGEIPMRKWAVPWDFQAAEEANRRALDGGWPVVNVGVTELGGGAGGGKKREEGGWGRWFGRGKGRGGVGG